MKSCRRTHSNLLLHSWDESMLHWDKSVLQTWNFLVFIILSPNFNGLWKYKYHPIGYDLDLSFGSLISKSTSRSLRNFRLTRTCDFCCITQHEELVFSRVSGRMTAGSWGLGSWPVSRAVSLKIQKVMRIPTCSSCRHPSKKLCKKDNLSAMMHRYLMIRTSLLV